MKTHRHKWRYAWERTFRICQVKHCKKREWYLVCEKRWSPYVPAVYEIYGHDTTHHRHYLRHGQRGYHPSFMALQGMDRDRFRELEWSGYYDRKKQTAHIEADRDTPPPNY